MPPAARLPPTAPDRPAPPGRRAAAVNGRPPVPAYDRAKAVPVPPPKKPSWVDRVRGGTFGLIGLCLAGLCGAGLLVRLTVRDGFRPLAPAFYAASVPVLVLLACGAVACFALAKGLRLTWKRAALAVGVGGVLGLYAAVFLFQDALFDDRPRVVTWNVARGAMGWEGVADALADQNPTLAVLTEAGDDELNGTGRGGGDDFWRGRFPDHFLARPGGAITILSRGPLGRTEFRTLPGGGSLAVTTAKLGGERVSVLAVDLPGKPLAQREKPLAEVAALAAELAKDRPVIVAGDFNTPPDSVFFGPLRRAGFAHAFEEHGRGYAATWPVPAPVLHLDHVWLSPGFDVGEAWHGWTAHSDHRPVLVPAEVSRKKFAAARAAATAEPDRAADGTSPE